MKRIIASIIPAINRLGAKPTIQFVVRTRQTKFRSSGTDLNIYVPNKAPNVAKGAEALLAQPEFKKTGTWKRAILLEEQRKNYLSIEVCPAEGDAPTAEPAGPPPVSNPQIQSQGITPEQNSELDVAYKRINQRQDDDPSRESPDTADALTKLAIEYQRKGNFSEAEPLLQKALLINERTVGPDHPDTATSLNKLAELYRAQGQYAKAEPLYQRALVVTEKALGPKHPDTAKGLSNLAHLYLAQGKYGQAAPLYQRELAIWENLLGTEHFGLIMVLRNLAATYDGQGQHNKAEPFYQRSFWLAHKRHGPEHPTVLQTFVDYQKLLEASGLPHTENDVWEKLRSSSYAPTSKTSSPLRSFMRISNTSLKAPA